jgi:hypothetical protein
MKTALKNQIETFLKSLEIDNLELMDYINIEEIELNNAFDSIYGQLDDNGALNIEIVYYSNAMQYLSENDNSLNESINIALDLGYELKNINSELLASLLASQNARNDFYQLENKIDTFFNSLEEE